MIISNRDASRDDIRQALGQRRYQLASSHHQDEYTPNQATPKLFLPIDFPLSLTPKSGNNSVFGSAVKEEVVCSGLGDQNPE